MHAISALAELLVITCPVLCRRDPTTLTESKKKHPSTNKDASGESIVQKKPTASRHILLIRHGQYNVDGESDDKRTLTPLGCFCDDISRGASKFHLGDHSLGGLGTKQCDFRFDLFFSFSFSFPVSSWF